MNMKQPLPHSPAPWSVARNELGGYVILDASGFTVAEIEGPPVTPSYDRQAGDAQLMAGAPGLLEACHVAVAFLEDKEDGEPLSGDEVLSVLRNAIGRTVVTSEEDDGE
jgi:hypothetical protein